MAKGFHDATNMLPNHFKEHVLFEVHCSQYTGWPFTLAQNLPLTPKQRLCFSKWASYQNGTFVFKSTGGLRQGERSPCSWSSNMNGKLRALLLPASASLSLSFLCHLRIYKMTCTLRGFPDVSFSSLFLHMFFPSSYADLVILQPSYLELTSLLSKKCCQCGTI